MDVNSFVAHRTVGLVIIYYYEPMIRFRILLHTLLYINTRSAFCTWLVFFLMLLTHMLLVPNAE